LEYPNADTHRDIGRVHISYLFTRMAQIYHATLADEYPYASLMQVVSRGVTVRFGPVFSQKNVWTNKFFVGSVFTLFQKRNRTKQIGLVWFRSLRLIGLFESRIKKKNYILTNLYFVYTTYIILKYFMKLCISYCIFSCSLFFQTTFYNQQMDDLSGGEERSVRCSWQIWFLFL